MRSIFLIFNFLCFGMTLLGQAIYQPRPQTDKSCPRIEAHEDTLFKTGGKSTSTGAIQGEVGTMVRSDKSGSPANSAVSGVVADQIMGKSDLGEMVPKAERSSASTFAVLDVQGKTLQVSDLKGKVLVVGFWQTTCGPSINLLNELVDYQAKGEKFNFAVWPVNMDDAQWSAIMPFANRNKKFFEKTHFYLPGIGATGPSVFMKVLPVLPALFILDKEGRIAFKMMGYEPNALVNALKKILVEK